MQATWCSLTANGVIKRYETARRTSCATSLMLRMEYYSKRRLALIQVPLSNCLFSSQRLRCRQTHHQLHVHLDLSIAPAQASILQCCTGSTPCTQEGAWDARSWLARHIIAASLKLAVVQLQLYP